MADSREEMLELLAYLADEVAGGRIVNLAIAFTAETGANHDFAGQHLDTGLIAEVGLLHTELSLLTLEARADALDNTQEEQAAEPGDTATSVH